MSAKKKNLDICEFYGFMRKKACINLSIHAVSCKISISFHINWGCFCTPSFSCVASMAGLMRSFLPGGIYWVFALGKRKKPVNQNPPPALKRTMSSVCEDLRTNTGTKFIPTEEDRWKFLHVHMRHAYMHNMCKTASILFDLFILVSIICRFIHNFCTALHVFIVSNKE